MRDQRQREDDKESEVTLSPATLLGIFLGLVLVCGVFFGFGYSVGRRASSGGSIAPSADSDAQETDTPVSPSAKPSAARTLDTDDAVASNDGPSSAASSTLLEPSASSPTAMPVADAPVTTPAAGAMPATARSLKNLAQPQNDGAPATGQTVVQVAAVTRQEDAEVLVSALRQRGYHAMERSEPQDKLVHVQVGPFSSREEANAMKQKLLADGYNAIIK